MKIYVDTHIMSFAPGDCIECGGELKPVEYYCVDEFMEMFKKFAAELKAAEKAEHPDIEQFYENS